MVGICRPLRKAEVTPQGGLCIKSCISGLWDISGSHLGLLRL